MSERKVLNKYYPPDYDPSKIPKLKRAKDRQYVIRVMAPFNMRCKTCGNYIYKGTKFNARMETVQDENYLGLRIYRFYIKCTRCVAEITFKTDPENQDYSVEHGATRNFEAEKLIEQEEKRLQAKREEEESNPMKMLEIRTRDSKREMEMMESLEELRELNQRHAGINYEGMLQRRQETEEERIAREKEEEDEEIRKIFNKGLVRRLVDESSDEDEEIAVDKSPRKRPHPTTEILTQDDEASSSKLPSSTSKSAKMTSAMLGIVKKKKQDHGSSSSAGTSNSKPSSSKPAKITSAMLGIVQKKKEVETGESLKNEEVESNNANAIDKHKASENSKNINGIASGGGMSLLAGYGSASDSTDSE